MGKGDLRRVEGQLIACGSSLDDTVLGLFPCPRPRSLSLKRNLYPVLTAFRGETFRKSRSRWVGASDKGTRQIDLVVRNNARVRRYIDWRDQLRSYLTMILRFHTICLFLPTLPPKSTTPPH